MVLASHSRGRGAGLEQPLLVVSPHFDDAALSCFGMLHAHEHPAVLTVMAGEPSVASSARWDRESGFGGSAEAVRVRRIEDTSALGGLASELVYGSLIDGAYLDGARDPSDCATLRHLVDSWREGRGRVTLAIPVGAGRRPRPWPLAKARGGVSKILRVLDGAKRRVEPALRHGRPPQRSRRPPPFGPHPDHLFVRNVALARWLGDPTVDLVLYDEYPYSLTESGAGEVRTIVRHFGVAAERIEVPVDPGSKAAANAHYESQRGPFAALDLDLADPAAYPATEVYWRLGTGSPPVAPRPSGVDTC